MDDKEKRLVNISNLTGVSNRLTLLPITEFGFELSKQPFWDSIKLQYSVALAVVYLIFNPV